MSGIPSHLSDRDQFRPKKQTLRDLLSSILVYTHFYARFVGAIDGGSIDSVTHEFFPPLYYEHPPMVMKGFLVHSQTNKRPEISELSSCPEVFSVTSDGFGNTTGDTCSVRAVSRYMSVAAMALWVYDYILTIVDELELLWSRNGIMIKALYLVGRYLPIAGMTFIGNNMLPTWQSVPAVKTCRETFVVFTLCVTIQHVVSMIIFTTRLCAIFFMRSNVQRLLVFSLVASLVALLVFHIFTFINVLPGMIWATHLRACVTPDYRTWAIGATSLTPIFMESLIFFATLFHAFEQQRNNLRVMETSTGGVLQRLYMDGIQYYMLALLFRLGAVLTFYRAPIGLILLFYHFEYLATSMLTSRFFLSFRRKLVNSQTVPSETAEITGAEIPGCLALGVELTDVVNVGTEEYAMVETRMTREHESSYGTTRPFLDNRLV